MNTKLALELLTQSHDDLTAFLSALGLLGNETAITDLKTQFDLAFQAFLDEYEALKTPVEVTTSQVKTVEEKLELGQEYYQVEAERLSIFLTQKEDLVKEIEILEEHKASIEQIAEGEKQAVEAKIEEIEQDINNTEADLAQLRESADPDSQQIEALQAELNAHILRLQLQQDILSLSGLDVSQQLATVELQI